ncbi:MAG: COX15/CtaA family protein [Hyphomonas sp.]|uniref:COX15/CtaA family protein n=1 Tax=Hyphomonas sp. TaxID=87 RepID=UPI00349FF433
MAANAISPVAARWIRAWLILLGLLVYATILVGGATRLTDSGLSITEWQPVKGALPPLDQASWLAEFDKYRETTQYKLQNKGMSLAEFQFIYGWEWGHRQLGRFIGLVAVAGLAVFAARRWLGGGLGWKLAGLVALGGLQGAIGWWMVASGIGDTDRVSVAPYRLMTHFSLALLILCVITWLWLSLRGASRGGAPEGKRVAILLLALVFVQMAAGALVAGLDAGRSYNDWPLMAGELVPSRYIQADLGMRSLFEGRAATQFNHRFLAYILWGLSLWAAWRYRGGALARSFAVLAALVSAQAVWGILTLLNSAPLTLALVHQGLGVIVTLAAVHLTWQAGASRTPAPE